MDADEPVRTTRSLRDLDRSSQWWAIGLSTARILVIAASMLVIYFWLPFDRASVGETSLTVALALLVLVGANLYQLRAVANAEMPGLRGVEALVVSVLLLLVMFAAIYLSMSGRDPSAFDEPLDHVASLYFTMTTLTTIGFGDIVPVSSAARIIVMIQMAVDVVVVGVFVKLVTSTVRSRLSKTVS